MYPIYVSYRSPPQLPVRDVLRFTDLHRSSLHSVEWMHYGIAWQGRPPPLLTLFCMALKISHLPSLNEKGRGDPFVDPTHYSLPSCLFSLPKQMQIFLLAPSSPPWLGITLRPGDEHHSGRRDFDITEIDITQSAITEFDITDTAITESDITESAITRKGKLL